MDRTAAVRNNAHDLCFFDFSSSFIRQLPLGAYCATIEKRTGRCRSAGTSWETRDPLFPRNKRGPGKPSEGTRLRERPNRPVRNCGIRYICPGQSSILSFSFLPFLPGGIAKIWRQSPQRHVGAITAGDHRFIFRFVTGVLSQPISWNLLFESSICCLN